jgi:glutathione synthase/RimK-type ligase-like ATP-grasp enzyme
MKKILLITRQPTGAFYKFRDLLEKEYEVIATTYSSLAIQATNKLDVIDIKTGAKLEDVDMVFMATIGREFEEIASAVTQICHEKDILCICNDLFYARPNGKILQAVMFMNQNVPTIPTMGFTDVNSANFSAIPFDIPFVLKKSRGSKGRDNFLIKNKSQFEKVREEYSGEEFVAQKMINNNGDFRVLVLGFKARLVMFRRRKSDDTHLNNTSQGASSEILEVSELPPDVIALCEETARNFKLEVAGLDVIKDIDSGEWLIIEINQSPQIISGTAIDQKTSKVLDYFSEILS